MKVGRSAALLIPLAIAFAIACGAEPRAAAVDATPDSLAGSPAAGDEPWRVSPVGIGPIRAGMTQSEAHAALGGDQTALAATTGEGCDHVALTGLPDGVLAMVLEGRVVRIDVRDSTVASDRGVRVGDSEARVEALYAGRIRREPHKYTDGSYLIVAPDAPADSAYRLIFETEGARVREYRAGLLPAVAWVEGCS